MSRLVAFALIVAALGLVGPIRAVAAEPGATPPVVVGQGRNAGIFVTGAGRGVAPAASADLVPEAPGSGTMQYVDIATIVVIYTDYYHNADCQMHMTAGDVAVLQAEVEKTRWFNWRSSHMKCNMKIDYLIIGDDPGERTLTPDMMWDWAGNGGHWLPFWSCDGVTSVEDDLYDNGVEDGDYSVVMVLYAFKNCDTVFSPIGGGTYGVDMGCMGDAAYIGNPVAWGLGVEGVCTHEYLHALDSIFQYSGNPLGSDPHSADQPATFPYPKDCGLHFNFLINNVLNPASWLLLYPQWAVVQTVLDSDDDGVPDAGDLPITELTMGTAPNDADSDDDGLSDLAETMAAYYAVSDPLDPDSDGDGVRDGDDPFPLYYCNDFLGEGTPTIDGVIGPGEYTEVSRFEDAAPDYGAVVYARWADGVLYIAADVTDDMVGYPWNEPWWDDNFEIQIDAGQDGWFVGGNPNYRFYVVPKGSGGIPYVRGDNYYDDPGNDSWHQIDVSAVTARYTTHSGGYSLELAIPESVMPGVTIERGATLRTTFFMLDYDTYPGWYRYNIMTKQLDDVPGFAYLHLDERDYYVNALTGDDGHDGEAAQWDGVHGPKQTIQAMIDAAMPPAVVNVAPGAYTESVVMASDVAVVGSGAAGTTIDSQDTGEAVLFSGVATRLAGFALKSGPTYTALRSINSTATARDCIAIGSTAGFGAGQTGSLELVNCLAAGNDVNGAWQSGAAAVSVRNCTLADNGDHGIVRWGTGAVTVTDSILDGNADDLDGPAFIVSYCDIGDGDYAGTSGNISADPLFVMGPLHVYYLSQTAAGQPSTSPCVDTGSTTASAAGLDTLTTRTDGGNDAGQVDMGYHAPYVPRITSIEQVGSTVNIHWNARPGASYVVGWSDDRVTWHEVPVGETGTWADVDAVLYSEKYYHVREQ